MRVPQNKRNQLARRSTDGLRSFLPAHLRGAFPFFFPGFSSVQRRPPRSLQHVRLRGQSTKGARCHRRGRRHRDGRRGDYQRVPRVDRSPGLRDASDRSCAENLPLCDQHLPGARSGPLMLLCRAFAPPPFHAGIGSSACGSPYAVLPLGTVPILRTVRVCTQQRGKEKKWFVRLKLLLW